MKTKLFGLVLVLVSDIALAIPAQVTYQGSIRKNGQPIDTTIGPPYKMSFLLYDDSGSPVCNLEVPSVSIHNGLFAVPLDFDAACPGKVHWEQYSKPVIQVTANGEVLSPSESINSSVYALVANTVPDGSITSKKLSSDAQSILLPSGMISMFDGDCPSGWTRFSAMDNRFPMGSASFGATGGSDTHTHTGTTSIASANYITFSGGSSADASHPAHTHSFTTSAASNVPPYLAIVYCRKN